MPNINKPFNALAYSALGVTLPPLVAKFIEFQDSRCHQSHGNWCGWPPSSQQSSFSAVSYTF